jgi:hypothetical protein
MAQIWVDHPWNPNTKALNLLVFQARNTDHLFNYRRHSYQNCRWAFVRFGWHNPPTQHHTGCEINRRRSNLRSAKVNADADCHCRAL